MSDLGDYVWRVAEPYSHRVVILLAEKNQRLQELEAKLADVRELPAKWRGENGDYPESKQDCADELETALGDGE